VIGTNPRFEPIRLILLIATEPNKFAGTLASKPGWKWMLTVSISYFEGIRLKMACIAVVESDEGQLIVATFTPNAFAAAVHVQGVISFWYGQVFLLKPKMLNNPTKPLVSNACTISIYKEYFIIPLN